MEIAWTESQLRRLTALDAPPGEIGMRFACIPDREQAFQKIESRLTRRQRTRLEALRSGERRPGLCRLESRLVERLTAAGFVQVATPVIMSRGLLGRMSIGSDHPLSRQVFWLDDDRCLRPMLAPHLYYVLKDLLRLWERPVRIFEVGPCFRKESHGARHANEFTMLNLVEMGLAEDAREARIRELGALVAETAGVCDYRFTRVTSEVYGATLDMEAGEDRLEIASSAMGPHPLDVPWKITDAWVGIGFGLERLLMAAGHGNSLAKTGRSLAYLDGIRLNV